MKKITNEHLYDDELIQELTLEEAELCECGELLPEAKLENGSLVSVCLKCGATYST